MRAEARLFAALADRYPRADKEDVIVAVARAVAGANFIGIDLDDLSTFKAAESNLRLTLGLDPDVARLDPEAHAARRGPKPKV